MDLKNFTNDIKEFSLDGETFTCKIVDVYDADTCKVVFVLNNKPVKFTCRLMGIDTPEMKPPMNQENRDKEKIAAKKARNRLIQLSTNCNCEIETLYKTSEIKKMILNNTKLISIQCHEFDKYGRLLATLTDIESDKKFNDILIEENYAHSYFGKTKQKFTY